LPQFLAKGHPEIQPLPLTKTNMKRTFDVFVRLSEAITSIMEPEAEV
jgi:hypothetical protein